MPGLLVVANTVEAFNVDRAAFLREHGAGPLVADLAAGDALASPARLCRFVLHVFPDLKRFTFKYWFAYPALQLGTSPNVGLASVQPLATLDGSDGILAACDSWLRSDAADVAWLVVRDSDGQAEAHPLSSWPALANNSAVFLAFADPCGLPLHPGWPLRNLLALARSVGIAGRLEVLSARMLAGRLVADRCLVFSVDLPGVPGERPGDTWLKADAVGWERDVHGELCPRQVDLKSTLDPHERAAQAADLNLKLMAWRMFPECDAAMLHGKRCLLIGAGTLGCAVARTLLGWGVRDMTFVDNGLVSFSNPLRQSLFEYEDCLDGGRLKAAAAAERLKRIFPKMDAKAECLTVPMPGHRVLHDDEASVLSDVARLDALIDTADCVFLLTDTRESRWLPTLLCAHHNKLLINSGLGFDSFVVMRHGCRSPGEQTRLGCYFCTDVMAPIDSTTHRSLDQQCTVTRPGLAFVAAALAVELAVSVWHHTEGPNAPAGSMSPLGEVPHQIRGALSRFEQRCFTGTAFHQCVACSDAVVDAYRSSQRDAFLLSVFNDGAVLERLTGLASLHEEAAVEACVWEEDEETHSQD